MNPPTLEPSATRLNIRRSIPFALLAVLLVLAFTNVLPIASQSPSQPSNSNANAATPQSARIYGVVKVGTIPVSAVSITAFNIRTREKFIAITDALGAYSVAVPPNGTYIVRAYFRGQTSAAREVTLTPESLRERANFYFQSSVTPQSQQGAAATSTLSSLWPSVILPPIAISTVSMQPAASNAGGSSGAQFPSFPGDASFSGDQFTVNGQGVIVIPYFQMADQLRQDFEDGHELQGPPVGPQGSPSGTNGESGANTTSNSAASSASNTTSSASSSSPYHGMLFWTGGNSVFNAEPFVLAGQPSPNPSYSSNGYGITIGGPPFLPGLTRPSARESLVVSFSGQLSTSLVNQYGIVPTELEREGNFSQLTDSTGQLIPIYPPRSLTPYPNNTIDTPLDSAALGLLQFLPLPNLQSAGLNYRLLTTQGTHTNTLGASFTHNFGRLPGSSHSSGAVPQQPVPDSQDLSQTLNLNFNFGDVATDVVNIFPLLGGKQRVQGYAINAAYTIAKNAWITDMSFTTTRNNSQVRNFFTGREDIASQLGIYAVSDSHGNNVPVNANPLNFGLPNLVFNNFTGMSETQPNFQLTQTFSVSNYSSWTHRNHIIRFGGDLHRIQFNLFGGTDATGTYIFTGGYTQTASQSNDNPVSPTGSSFADFLLGLPQATKLESPGQNAYTRQTNLELFVRDDWRLLPTFTLCLGLRYDYFSPFTEKFDRLSTLDYNSDFSDVAPVQPNQVGSVSGTKYPGGLISPDPRNFSPHIGFAWQAPRKFVVRAAYGINYTVGQYGTFIQNLAYQPPFADVQTNGNLPHDFTLFTLKYGFGNLDDFGNYAISRNYRLPYVQNWYLDVQRSLPLDVLLDVGYTGAKGARLDVISAPGPLNATPFSNAYFDFEDSTAFSTFNSLVARITKRMAGGFALQATYAYSHSIDDASSVNAGIPVVAQNAADILAEKSNSSFDIRHQITGSVLYQLPFGSKKPFLKAGNWATRVFGGWSISGYFTLATGVPLTPYVSASVAEVERGTHGSVRPDRVPGASITAGGGHLDRWFNTAAFSTNFAPGQLYGNASRYSIPGPGVENVNLSLSKVIALKESKTFEIRATASNAFNVVQYSGVNTQVGSSTFGYVDAVQPMRQITFLARFSF